ncbi:hypothetical protein ACFSBZ_14725 [Amnibacterium flavum]|uniref:Alkaline shock response membrane anchor protein AmaP n=1 Tax=Amnibacterium flavum TaxID=2173173 RepID=A0A2V1HTQ3_9MICO|nr:hypothetical protein [Amnibacterium flavum]PVZ95986.1 hypothetical protein DDQ50_05920 [Amnibacterium flavum]
MNNTNRFLNRAWLGLVGLLLLAGGAAAIALGSLPEAAERWTSTAPDVISSVSGWLRDSPVGDAGFSWLTIAVIAAIALIVVLLLVFIIRQGNGHTRELLRESSGDNGETIVEAAVAEQALREALHAHREFISSSVSTYRVRGASVLKISTVCQRGVSPTAAVRIVERHLIALDALLGREVPALLQISGGFRARTTGATRLL